jgi:RNA-directed DNA polymerase
MDFGTIDRTADAMSQLFVSLSSKASAQWVLEADIAGCFDNINHDWLIKNVPMERSILRKWLKSGLVYQGQFQETETGTPQGELFPHFGKCDAEWVGIGFNKLP